MKILNVQYDNITVGEALGRVLKFLSNGQKARVYFLNSDCIYKAQYDIDYRNEINSCELVLSDGIGLRIATWMFGDRMKDNCNGSDFSPILMQKAAERGYRVYFLGGREGVAEKAAENVRKSIPGIQIVGTHSGYFNNEDEIVKQINNSGADILFVALGVPLQEKWIAKHRQQMTPKVYLGVGALLDYLSGTVKRAPNFMREIHLEWFWRLLIDPKRMFKRYVIDGSKFFWIVLKQKFGFLK